jgi:hypothetical protein
MPECIMCDAPADCVVLWTACDCPGEPNLYLYCNDCRTTAARCRGCGAELRMQQLWRSLYDAYRETWISIGGIANKDAMVAAVTLKEPAAWDTWGSIMQPDDVELVRIAARCRLEAMQAAVESRRIRVRPLAAQAAVIIAWSAIFLILALVH